MFRSLFLVSLLLLVPFQVSAMQISDPRAAAVYIQKQRPLVKTCLDTSRRSHNLNNIWADSACEQLLARDKKIRAAWAMLLPEGTVTGLAAIPYGLRQLTVDAYAEYKLLAERIAQLAY